MTGTLRRREGRPQGRACTEEGPPEHTASGGTNPANTAIVGARRHGWEMGSGCGSRRACGNLKQADTAVRSSSPLQPAVPKCLPCPAGQVVSGSAHTLKVKVRAGYVHRAGRRESGRARLPEYESLVLRDHAKASTDQESKIQGERKRGRGVPWQDEMPPFGQ